MDDASKYRARGKPVYAYSMSPPPVMKDHCHNKDLIAGTSQTVGADSRQFANNRPWKGWYQVASTSKRFMNRYLCKAGRVTFERSTSTILPVLIPLPSETTPHHAAEDSRHRPRISIDAGPRSIAHVSPQARPKT